MNQPFGMKLRQTVATAALTFALLAPAVRAGCYSNDFVYFFNEDGSNFKFGHLHNNPVGYWNSDTQDVTQEVLDSIDTVCRNVDGAVVKPGTKWKQCQDWSYAIPEDSCTISDCGHECEGDYECMAECAQGCPDVEQGQNNLVLELAHDDDGDDTRTMTYDLCSAGLRGIFDECYDYGGNFEHDGFFFKLDPNPRSCDSLGESGLIKLIGQGKAPKAGKGGV